MISSDFDSGRVRERVLTYLSDKRKPYLLFRLLSSSLQNASMSASARAASLYLRSLCSVPGGVAPRVHHIIECTDCKFISTWFGPPPFIFRAQSGSSEGGAVDLDSFGVCLSPLLANREHLHARSHTPQPFSIPVHRLCSQPSVAEVKNTLICPVPSLRFGSEESALPYRRTPMYRSPTQPNEINNFQIKRAESKRERTVHWWDSAARRRTIDRSNGKEILQKNRGKSVEQKYLYVSYQWR